MEPSVEGLVEAIHASGWRAVIAVTGGGSQALAELLSVGGASRTLLEGLIPYSAAALCDLLRAKPEHYCSEETARAMAMASLRRAMRWSREVCEDESQRQPDLSPQRYADERLVGVSCTASLASDRPKKGDHRAHVGVQTIDFTSVTTLRMNKRARLRRDEEQLVARLILNGLAAACGVADELPLELLDGEVLQQNRADARPAWRDLLLGATRTVRIGEGDRAGRPTMGQRAVKRDRPTAVFPGAFHPLHEGHRRLAAIASELLRAPTEFEISVDNVDKPPLDYLEIEVRLAQFAPDQIVWLTRAPTFVEKARIFPGTTFVVGADTLARIAESRYYDDERARDAAIDEIAALGCRFLVFGRVDEHNRFRGPDNLELPLALKRLCQSVPEERFRDDISSTRLRRSAHPD